MHCGHISLDAASDGWEGSNPGIGGYNHETNEVFTTVVLPALRAWHISDLEIVAVLVAARIWSPLWRGRAISGLTDNESVRFLLTNGRTRSHLRLQMARTFSSLQLKHEFRWWTARVSTSENMLVDMASRWFQPGMQRRFMAHCATFGVTPSCLPVPVEYFHT